MGACCILTDIAVATASYDLANKDAKVIVNTTINRATFFAGTLGFPQAEVQAAAAAICGLPTQTENVLPISWACKTGVNDPYNPMSDIAECNVDNITIAALEEHYIQGIFGGNREDFYQWNIAGYPHPEFTADGIRTFEGQPQNWAFPPELYIIMDSDDSMDDMSTVCIINPWPGVEGEMDCDLDGDGFNDLLSSGTRSWLSFSGTESAADLKDWIENGYEEGLNSHSWLPAISGDPAIAYAYIQDRVGEIVLLPVYNQYCDYNPDPIHGPGPPPLPAINCLEAAGHVAGGVFEHHPPDDPYVEGLGSELYYHITGFAAFYITCVRDPNDGCPGADWLADEHDELFTGNNYKSIEGYFITGPLPYLGVVGGGGGGVDYGTYSIRLVPVDY